MKEFVTANGSIFECERVETGVGSITLIMRDQNFDDAKSFFQNVTELTTSFDKQNRRASLNGDLDLEEPHGVYKNLKLESVSENVEDGTISVTMHIKNEIEQRLDSLEKTEKIQNDVIAELTKTVGGE